MKYRDNNQKKSDKSNPTRKLSEFEQSFLEELKLYDQVLNTTILISMNQHGINTDGRGLRGIRIFTRQTVVGISLQRILPRPSVMKDLEATFWDVSSIASLSRNILEGFLSLYYFGIEKISDEEAELRFFIAQLHRNVEWYNIRKLANPVDPGLIEFQAGIASQKERIKGHNFLSSLTKEQKNKALRGDEMYKTKTDFENELEICKGLRHNYRLLSNLVHPLPISIERIDDDRGRGIGSDPDVNYCLISLMIARRFLAATTISIADHFPNDLASKFESNLNNIRPLTSTDFKE